MKEFLVKVTETYQHTVLVEAESEEDAREIAEDEFAGCDSDDFVETEYEVREPKDEDLSLYERL